jgi:hypothetical protein
VEFETNNVYRVFPLPFGGLLAFDQAHIYLFKKKFRNKLVTKELGKSFEVTGIDAIDKFDP